MVTALSALTLVACSPSASTTPKPVTAAGPSMSAPGVTNGVPSPGNTLLTNDSNDAQAWPFWPRSMRIHPLTRYVREMPSNRLLLELRVEFLDEDDHTCKAFGRVRIDLHDRQGGTAGVASLVTWEVDLTDLITNRERYDVVTRTYLFLLGISDEERPGQPEIRVYYMSEDGELLEASAVLTSGDE
ncbi:MAG: hypothetical protein AAF432_13525 [Planctomycetota bacterium]